MSGELVFGLGALIAIGALGALISFGCDELSEKEKRKQSEMRQEYNEYTQRRSDEYREIREHYKSSSAAMRREHEASLAAYRRKLIEKCKEENYGIYVSILGKLDEQYQEKRDLLADCQKAIDICQKSSDKHQNTYASTSSSKKRDFTRVGECDII